MSKYIDAEKLKAEIERRKELLENGTAHPEVMKRVEGALKVYNSILDFITSLQQEQPKFNVGDLVVSKKNPHLTYRILATNIPNELGKTDYKVEIFTEGKPGLLSEPHNIHLISSDKIEDWGELVQQEQPEVDWGEFDKEVAKLWGSCAAEPNDSIACLHVETFSEVARHFYELGINARKED